MRKLYGIFTITVIIGIAMTTFFLSMQSYKVYGMNVLYSLFTSNRNDEFMMSNHTMATTLLHIPLNGYFWGFIFIGVLVLLWIYSIVVIVTLIIDNRNAEKTLAWILVIIFFPIVGVVIYLFLGDSRQRVQYYKNRIFYSFSRRCDLEKNVLRGSAYTLSHYLNNRGKMPLQCYNDIEVFTNGNSLFTQLFHDIEAAKKFIHIEVYILNNDQLGNCFRKNLIEKAKQGVEVRLLLDFVGSRKIGKKFIKSMEQAGIHFAYFLPNIRREMNYRNHRKLTIIDGKISYIGGFNIGDEYLGRHKKLGSWRDTHLRIIGEGVALCQEVFANDWIFATFKNKKLHRDLFHENYFPEVTPEQRKALNFSPIQLSYSGLDAVENFIYYQYYLMITQAKERLWFTTPYLILPSSIRTALKLAAYSGVDVRVIIPNRIDHISAFIGSRGNVEELLRAGVRVYAYNHGFIHAKVVIKDFEIASVGTANMDIRSLQVNYEVNALLYERGVIEKLSEQFERDCEESIEFEYESWRRRPKYKRFAEGLYKLFSPLL